MKDETKRLYHRDADAKVESGYLPCPKNLPEQAELALERALSGCKLWAGEQGWLLVGYRPSGAGYFALAGTY